MRADLNVCMVARKHSRIIEGPHDLPGRLSWRRQLNAHGPFVRSVEPIITEPDHHHGPVVEQPVKNNTTRNNPRISASAAHLLGPRFHFPCRGFCSLPELPPVESPRRWNSAPPT